MFSNYYTKKQNKRKFSLNNWHENYMKIVEQAKKKLKSEKVDASFLYSLLLLCTSMCANACWYIHVRVNFVVFSTIFLLFTSSLCPRFLKGSLYFWEWSSSSCFLYRCSEQNIASQYQEAKRGSKPPLQPFPFHTICAALKHGLQPDSWFIWTFIHPWNSDRATTFRPDRVHYYLVL